MYGERLKFLRKERKIPQKDLAELLNISDTQMSYITNAGAGRGLIKVGGSIVPFINDFPTDTELYRLMSTKPGES